MLFLSSFCSSRVRISAHRMLRAWVWVLGSGLDAKIALHFVKHLVNAANPPTTQDKSNQVGWVCFYCNAPLPVAPAAYGTDVLCSEAMGEAMEPSLTIDPLCKDFTFAMQHK